MNFTHLLAFLEVARAGSITAGAERLHVSQPAVTRELKELEDRLGVKLLDRQPRGVTLTEAGDVLRGYAERIFAMADVAEQELRELAGISSGHLAIGASATVGVYRVPDYIALFNAQYPKVSVELIVTNTEQVEQGLLEHRFRLGFVEGPFDPQVFDAHRIGSDEIVAVCSPLHPLASRTIAPKDMAEKVVILREPGSGTRATVEAAYASLGIPIVPLMSVSNTEAIKRMLMAEPAIAFVSSLSVETELERGALVRMKVRGLKIQRDLHMIWLKVQSHSPSAAAFAEIVLARGGADELRRSSR